MGNFGLFTGHLFNFQAGKFRYLGRPLGKTVIIILYFVLGDCRMYYELDPGSFEN